MKKFIVVFIILLITILSFAFERPTKWKLAPFTDEEIDKMFAPLPAMYGIPYVWGGYLLNGIDCSGMVIFLYNYLGYDYFVSHFGQLRMDITAHEFYMYNCVKLDFSEIKHGDLIFFESTGDNRIDHIGLFDKIDEKGNVWIWDAVDITDNIIVNKVSHRILKENPRKTFLWGRPLKVVSLD